MENQVDALASFNFDSVTGSGLFLKWQAGKSLTLRVLTVDPIVSNEEFEDKQTGEKTPRTRFAFIVYNFTDSKAQILQTTPTIARKIGELHTDPDFGANIRKIDIKITPTGEGLERRYDIQVLPTPRTLTNEQVQEAQAINLDDKVQGVRMSQYNPKNPSSLSSVPVAKEEPAPVVPDRVIEDITDEPINLDDIPFN